jgi:hypothetical protein
MSQIRARHLPLLIAVVVPALIAVSLLWVGQAPPTAPGSSLRGPSVKPNDHHDTSPPLRVIPPAPRGEPVEREEGVLPRPATVAGAQDTVIQSTAAAPLIPTTSTNFDGIGQGFSGPQGTFTVNSAPPDTNGDIGPNHYVQTVNSDFAVFNRSGTVVYGPVPINTLWSGFGGLCQTDNDGDPTVKYDRLSDRWVITQFAVSGANGTTSPFLQCVAVSKTGDPTGAYHRYSFAYTSFPDYPKLGVWPDAYYETFNLFNAAGTAFLGGLTCAYDRTRMLAGLSATQQCFTTSNVYGGQLPSDLDGQTLPPAGSPNYVVALGANTTQLASWKFHVDWTTPANSTFSGPTALTTAAYLLPCGPCVPQSGTTNKLDTLGDRLMYRLAYRNFGDHQSLVVDHSVTSGSTIGVRWYELRVAAGAVSLFQQGTYGPDSSYRWMGSIAQDRSGNIGLGFSASSSSLHPQIRYTGRLAGDPLGTMTQGEGTIISGAGSQTGTLDRWGDYSAMAVDPVDDCTFWYTTEYLAANGSFNWHTRIASFKFPGCGSTANDFSIAANPTALTIAQGASGTSAVSTSVTGGVAETVNLTVTGAPAGASASLAPASVTAGGASTLTVGAGTAAPGTYTLTITGTAPSATHTTTVSLTVPTPVSNDFSITANPNALTIAQGASGVSTIGTAVTSGVSAPVALTVSGAPSGVTATLNPASVGAGLSSTLSIDVAATAGVGVYPLTVTGVEGGATHTTTVSLTVVAPVANAVVNGGFETGTLSGWKAAGTAAVITTGHTGASARLGAPTATRKDSSVSQTFTVPAGATTLSFWYQVHCPDVVTNDWATATLKDTVTRVTKTILAMTCTNNGSWVQLTWDVSAQVGHGLTLKLISHDNAVAATPTYTLYDDVIVR